MNKIISTCLVLFLLIACDRKPYVEHKVDLEKKADNCAGIQSSFGLNSNFGGERYQFEKCLPAGYDKSLIKSERQGDTVLVSFGIPPGGQQQVLYKVTLDIDSYPKYSSIVIDGDHYTVGSTDK
jgi:hypothetical protein